MKFGVFLLCVIGIIYLAHRDNVETARYMKENHCVKTGKSKNDWYMETADGTTFYPVDDYKDMYKCDTGNKWFSR